MSDARRGQQHIEARRNAATCLALAGLLGAGAGMLALATLVLPRFFSAFLLIVAGFGGFTLLHYLTWGRWLSQPRPGDAIDDGDREIPERTPDDFTDVD